MNVKEIQEKFMNKLSDAAESPYESWAETLWNTVHSKAFSDPLLELAKEVVKDLWDSERRNNLHVFGTRKFYPKGHNFRNMLMTNHGERLGRFDYGANLLPLAFELATEDGDEEAS